MTTQNCTNTSTLLPASTTASQHVRTGATANILTATNACHWENIQVFTGNGTFNVPADVDLVYAIAVGSGGAGGRNANAGGASGSGIVIVYY